MEEEGEENERDNCSQSVETQQHNYLFTLFSLLHTAFHYQWSKEINADRMEGKSESVMRKREREIDVPSEEGEEEDAEVEQKKRHRSLQQLLRLPSIFHFLHGMHSPDSSRCRDLRKMMKF